METACSDVVSVLRSGFAVAGVLVGALSSRDLRLWAKAAPAKSWRWIQRRWKAAVKTAKRVRARFRDRIHRARTKLHNWIQNQLVRFNLKKSRNVRGGACAVVGIATMSATGVVTHGPVESRVENIEKRLDDLDRIGKAQPAYLLAGLALVAVGEILWHAAC